MTTTGWDAWLVKKAAHEAKYPAKDGTINAATLRALQGRASMVALGEQNPAHADRFEDDVHDLLNTVIGILEDYEMELITDPYDVDVAFTASHV